MAPTSPDSLFSALALFGTDEPVPASRRFRVGPLSAVLDRGNLRDIRIAGREAVRGIAFLVRDRNWGTYDAALSNLMIDERSEAFVVSYTAACKDGAQELRYDVSIEGRADGTLTFEATLTPLTDFATCRAGFVVLHPLDGVAGQPVEIEHTDGSIEKARFPDVIAPAQPFFDMRALTHEVRPGLRARVDLLGDTFEMEDQRNWTDASFKTYVRPLALPYPYTLLAGVPIKQAVKLSIAGPYAPAPASVANDVITLRLGNTLAAVMPRIGLGLDPRQLEDAARAVASWNKVGVQVLVVRVDLRDCGSEVFGRLRALGEASGAALVLEVVVPCGRAVRDELEELAAFVKDAGLALSGLAVSPASHLKDLGDGLPDVPALEDLYVAARAAFPGVPVGGGTFAYFTELNRTRPPAQLLDFVTHTTCAIIHAADDASVMQTLEAMPSIIASTRAFAGRASYHIGPSALGMRENPYGETPAANPDNRRVPMALVDPRQRGLFGAAFALGLAAHAARGGVDVVTMNAPTGPFGILYTPGSETKPWYDDRGEGLYPAFHVMRALASAAGKPRVAADSSDSHRVEAIAFRDGPRTSVLLGNLTPAEQRVRIEAGMALQQLASLDEAHFAAAAADPAFFSRENAAPPGGDLILGPHAVVVARS
jgi:hypothetical protein